MFYEDEEFEEEFDEMAPEEESFPVEEGYESPSNTKLSNAKNTLSELKQRSGQGSKNDADRIKDTLSKNKSRNVTDSLANAKGSNNKESDDENSEDNAEAESNPEKKVDKAVKEGAGEVAKKAASTFLQSNGVPAPAADKIADEAVNSEVGQKVLDEAVKKFKEGKRKIIMQVLAAILPYFLIIFMIGFVVAAIIASYATIVEKTQVAGKKISTGIEKYLNFTSGDGWNTEEEQFFKTLKEEYNTSLGYSDTGIDIPLLAATIHYENMIDVSVYEDSIEMDSIDDIGSDNDSSALFDSFISAQETRRFYYVANDKLGSLTDFKLGQRRLIGHMMDVKITWGKYKFADAMATWNKFLNFFGVVASDSSINSALTTFNLGKIYEHIASYASQDGDSALGYYARNIAYEAKELTQLLGDSFGEGGANAGTDEIINDGSDLDTKKQKGIWPAPNLNLVYNEEKYFDYLVNVYVPGTFYSKGEGTEEDYIRIAKEIFEQRDAYYYLIGDDAISLENSKDNNISINIKDCSGRVSVEQVTLEEYLSGVIYAEGGIYNSEEYLKAQAIASKNYLYAINGATTDNMPKTLSISSCSTTQLYCSTSKGCHELEDGTLVSGPDSDGSYYLEPLSTSDNKSKLKRILDSTYETFIVDESGKIIKTNFVASCIEGSCDDEANIMDKSVAISMARDGSSYNDILLNFYQGTLKTIELNKYSFPLDIMHNNITSRFGYRNHPTLNCCKVHSGIDLGAPQEASIYSYADGVVVTNKYDASYGFYLVIGHGENKDGFYEYYTLYAHQVRQPIVYVNQKVSAGEIVGHVGSTGRSTGPHLHFEIYKYVNSTKTNMDPYTYLQPLGVSYGGSKEAFSSLNACINAGHSTCG